MIKTPLILLSPTHRKNVDAFGQLFDQRCGSGEQVNGHNKKRLGREE